MREPDDVAEAGPTGATGDPASAVQSSPGRGRSDSIDLPSSESTPTLPGDPEPMTPEGAMSATTAPVAPRPQSPLRVIARGGAWTTIAQIVSLVVNVVLTPYVIHGFGIQRYGLFLLCTTVTAFLASFDGGIGASTLRFYSGYAGTDDRTRATSLATTLAAIVAAVGVTLFALLYLLAPAILAAFRIPAPLRGEGEFLLRAMAFVIALTQIRVLFTAQLSARQRYALQSIIGMMSYVVYTIGLVFTVHGHHGLRGVALTLVAQGVFATALIVPSACRYFVRSGLHFMPRSEVRAFLRYAGNIQAVGIATLVGAQVDTFVVGALLPVSSVAVYSSGANFANQLRTVPINALGPMSTILSRRYGAEGDEAAKTEFVRLQRAWVRGVAGWSAVAMGAAYFGVLSWLGPQFRLSGVVATLLVVSNAINLWTGPLTLLAGAVGRPELETRYGIVGAVVNIALTVPLVIAFGLLGTVVATAVGQIAGSLFLVRIVHRKYDPQLRSFLKEVPTLSLLFVAALVAAGEFVAYPAFPRGALGLVSAGLVATPGLVLYAVLVFGPRVTMAFVRRRFSRTA